MAGCWGYARAHLWRLLFQCEFEALPDWKFATGELMKNTGFRVRSNHQVSAGQTKRRSIKLTIVRPNPDSGMLKRTG